MFQTRSSHWQTGRRREKIKHNLTGWKLALSVCAHNCFTFANHHLVASSLFSLLSSSAFYPGVAPVCRSCDYGHQSCLLIHLCVWTVCVCVYGPHVDSPLTDTQSAFSRIAFFSPVWLKGGGIQTTADLRSPNQTSLIDLPLLPTVIGVLDGQRWRSVWIFASPLHCNNCKQECVK